MDPVERETTVKTPDKGKRDEWSEGGVISLLDEYESKWMLRNRAKLKGSDWDDIANKVSLRESGKKAPKTPTQCKNKIESMKKRYRVEAAVVTKGSSSSWQFFSRMDHLLKGKCLQLQLKGKDNFEAVVVQKVQNCKQVDVEDEDQVQGSNQDGGFNIVEGESESSRPRSKNGTFEDGFVKMNNFKRKRSFQSEVAESIRLLSHSILKIEKARLEMHKDSEKLRAEAEIRRAELELKKTEIIAQTQLQIAKISVKRLCEKKDPCEGSSLQNEQVETRQTEEKNG